MTGFTLNQAELEELTGSPRGKRQLQWLQQHGIPAVFGQDGKVKVLRAAVEAKMMPSKGRPAGTTRTEPDLSLIRRAS